MTAEEYLERIKRLNIMIKQKLVDLEELRSIAVSLGVPMGEKVVSSRKDDKISAAVQKIIEKENEIKKTIDMYYKEKEKIENQIKSLDSDIQYKVLSSKFIYSKSFKQIAYENDYSPKQIKRIYDKAINKFADMYADDIKNAKYVL